MEYAFDKISCNSFACSDSRRYCVSHSLINFDASSGSLSNWHILATSSSLGVSVAIHVDSKTGLTLQYPQFGSSAKAVVKPDFSEKK